MKIVKQISTGKILYRSEPSFETGKGIINARAMFSNIPEEDMAEVDTSWTEQEYIDNTFFYQDKRRAEYPPVTDYLDGIVKGDAAQVQKYINDCLAVKAKYPKPEGII